MGKSLPRRRRLTSPSFTAPSLPPKAAVGPRRRALGLAGAGVLVLLAAVLFGWRWHQMQRAAPTAPPIVPPLEARLLAAVTADPADPRPCLALAEQYAASARPASALWAYSEAAARAPGDAVIRLKLADALRQFGYPSVAEQALRSLAAGPAATAAPARLDLADLLIATGRPEAARAVVTGSTAEAELMRGRAAAAAGDAAAAARAYAAAAAAGNAEGYARLARLDLAQGRVLSAQQAIRDLDRLRPGQPEELRLAAAALAAGGTAPALDAALAVLLQCARLQPRDAEVYYQAGLLFLRKGDRASARAQFDRAIVLDPQHAAARAHLADLLQAAGDTGRAHRERAAYFAVVDQPDRSLIELRRAGAAGYEDDRERTLTAVRTASELQQLPAAVAEAEAGLKRHPGDADLATQLGLLYQMMGSRAALETLCRQWMARQPATGIPYWLLGRRAMQEARAPEAIRLFQTACAKEPERGDFCTDLGGAYLMIPTPANTAQARVWLEKAIRLSGRSAEAHRQLAQALERQHEPDASRQQYLAALDVAGGSPALLNDVAQLLFRLRRPGPGQLFATLSQAEEARTRQRLRFSRQVRDHPEDAPTRVAFARFLIRQGQLDAARNQLARAAEPGPAAPSARALLVPVERWLRVSGGKEM